LAFDVFVHRLRSGIAAMAAALGGLEALVFTAGIGENATEVRRATCAGLAFLGVHLDETRNAGSRGDDEISASESRVRVLVLKAQEDWAITAACWKLLRNS
jgi:acetate kinase